MSDLLREIAGLPQLGGTLSVELLASEPSRRFYLLRTATRPGADLAALQADETEGYARLLSGAPAMLDLLAVLLLRWGEAVEADEAIDGSEAVAWLSEFVAEVRLALQGIVGPRTPAWCRDRGRGHTDPSPARGQTTRT